MKKHNYFDSPAIGSSLLSSFIQSPDHALMKTTASNYMERGRIWEDLIEYMITEDEKKFKQKYYLSELEKFPTSTTYSSIPDIMDNENVVQTISNGYIYNKLKKGEKKPSLNRLHATRHSLLDEIKVNGYKKPIPKECWEKLLKMWENFQKAHYKGRNIVSLLKGLDDVKFQTEHYWKDMLCGAECRMKSDIEATYSTKEGRKGIIFDIKWTSNMSDYGNSRFRWQDRHYTTGYGRKCRQNDIEPPPSMIFLISEYKEPYLTYIWSLDDYQGITENQSDYQAHVEQCGQWIDAGKPLKGYKEQTVNKYFRPNN